MSGSVYVTKIRNVQRSSPPRASSDLVSRVLYRSSPTATRSARATEHDPGNGESRPSGDPTGRLLSRTSFRGVRMNLER